MGGGYRPAGAALEQAPADLLRGNGGMQQGFSEAMTERQGQSISNNTVTHHFGEFLAIGAHMAFLFGAQVAQGVGEVASIGNLVLAGARDVLHPVCEAACAAHLFGQCHHQVAIIPFGQLLSQCMAQDLGTPIDATGTHAGLARKWDCHYGPGNQGRKQRQAVAWVPATQELFHYPGRLQRERAVGFLVARVVATKEFLPMIDQNPP